MSAASLAGLSPGVRRFAALGLLFCLLIGLFSGVIRPLIHWANNAAEELADARFELQHAQWAAMAATSVSPSQVQAAEAAVETWLVPGASEADAATSLQAAVESKLIGDGLIIQSQRAVPPSAVGAVQRLAIDWRGSGTELAVTRALSALEQTRPLISIERLTIRVVNSGAPGASQANSPQVEIELQAAAFWSPPLVLAAPPQTKASGQP